MLDYACWFNTQYVAETQCCRTAFNYFCVRKQFSIHAFLLIIQNMVKFTAHDMLLLKYLEYVFFYLYINALTLWAVWEYLLPPSFRGPLASFCVPSPPCTSGLCSADLRYILKAHEIAYLKLFITCFLLALLFYPSEKDRNRGRIEW